MVFSSLTFLIIFLPAMLFVYYAVPVWLRNAVLFAGSLIFYAWGEPVYVCLMIFSTVLDFCCGRYVEKNKRTNRAKIGLIVSVVVNIGLLCFFKYSGFIIGTLNNVLGLTIYSPNLPLPIGISFYTFQTMSYTIDVYRGETKAQNNIINFGAYVTLFPQLIAGPIVRYSTIAMQLEDRKYSFDSFGDGVRRFVCGLGKKVLLANNIGELWSCISGLGTDDMSVLTAWLGIAAFAFQIYFDFSGYSDMAIGLGKMLGFDFMENFNYPYISKSVTEFWRRWHISLGSWFRDYVYIPLGGNRVGRLKWFRNIAVVWLLTGLWHGSGWNYVLWGVFYAILLVLEKLFLLKWLDRAPKPAGHIYTLIAVVFGWVLFAFEDMKKGLNFFAAMIGRGVPPVNDAALYNAISYAPLFLICAVAATPIGHSLYDKCRQHFGETGICVVEATGIVIIGALVTAYLISGSYNPFLYFRF